MQAKATFKTQNAARHMTALCKHFAKKVKASCAGSEGHVDFEFGTCTFTADDAQLTLQAQAKTTKQLNLVMDVVTRHLDRFAFRENPNLNWDVQPPPLSLAAEPVEQRAATPADAPVHQNPAQPEQEAS